jgi:threonine dehydratase
MLCFLRGGKWVVNLADTFVPENASSAKVDNIRNYNASLEFYGTDCVQTEMYAMDYAQKHNMIYISPYNDPEVISGQGTIGIELMRQLDNIDVVLVPIGGGGLISGIAGYLKAVSPNTKIIGCLPENSPVMSESIKAGKIIEMETKPTLSDATAGGIEPGAITFEICQRFVDDYILVSEDDIKGAIVSAVKNQRLIIEGAAAVALAVLIKNASEYRGKNVVVILCGGNISYEKLKLLIN